jgi:hypothetical protein
MATPTLYWKAATDCVKLFEIPDTCMDWETILYDLYTQENK